MPRPRFYKLDQRRRHDLLERATAEFVAHGYQGASLNRLLEAAELSKGSFYYYFDDRDDLFGAVLEHTMNFQSPPEALLTVTSAGAFWEEVDGWVESIYRSFLSSPEAMALTRELPKLVGVSPLPEAIQKMLGAMHRETVRILEVGQRVGAVRTDLPSDLLVTLVMKVGEAIDLWTAEHMDQVAQKNPAEMRLLSVSLFRRLLTP